LIRHWPDRPKKKKATGNKPMAALLIPEPVFRRQDDEPRGGLRPLRGELAAGLLHT